ncbi:MAG TPA: hypothetical protein VE377_22695 [Candidatus Dormibacteraeota bacterium]|nr:hypothetical protein [Candidatus Dormibacteraeota bacterium]
MNLAFRVFLFAYSVAMAAVVVGFYAQHNSDSLWPDTATIAFSYFVLAVGCTASRDRDRAPAPVWLGIAFGPLLLLPSTVLFAFLSERPPWPRGLPMAVIFTLVVLAYLGVAVILLRYFLSKEAHSRLRRILVPLALIAGAALVFSSLFLGITDNHGPNGWSILAFKAQWITSHINVGTPLFFGDRIEWLQPLYVPGGYITYLAALLATIVILIQLAAGRMSIDRSRESPLLTLPAVVISLASLWITTDIFWGWHFDLSSTTWTAVVATILWLTGPLFGAVVLVPLLWKRCETWRLRAFLLLQVPLATFNLVRLQAYFGYDSLEIPGLGTLIAGLLLESLACLALLAQRAKEDFVMVTSGEEASGGNSRPPQSSREAPKQRSA